MKFALSFYVTAVVMASTALAGEALIVQTDKTQLISVSAEPGTVVIGNPSIADVTVNGKQIFVHGHAFGDTNLLILDTNGNQIANFDITVAHANTNAMAMFKGQAGGADRTSFTCAPLCEATMQVGDPPAYTTSIIGVDQAKQEFATGKKSAEAAAPQAPQ